MNAGRSASKLIPGLACTLVFASSSLATGVFTTNPNLPANVGWYASDTDALTTYPIPGFSVVLKNNLMTPDAASASLAAIGADEQETFNVTSVADASVNGGAFGPSATSGVAMTKTLGKIGNTVGSFNAEMLQLDLSGSGVLVRESPTLQSLGQTVITDVGGGLYHIDSFFDVFTELSPNGGQNWFPATGPVHLVLTPEPASCLLLVLGAAAAMRRRVRA